MNWKRVSATGLGLCTSVVLVGVGFAADSERTMTMKSIGQSVRPLVQMAKSGQFNGTEAQKDGNAIAAALDHFKDLFPAGSEKEDEKALPTIWSDPQGFEQHRLDAKKAALAVAASTEIDGFRGALKSLGDACGACHDKYRAKQ